MGSRMRRLVMLCAVFALGITVIMGPVAGQAGTSCCARNKSETTSSKQCGIKENSPQKDAGVSGPDARHMVQTYQGAQANAGDRVTCPVTGNVMIVSSDTPSASINGKQYYVCSKACGEILGKEPDRYLKNSEKIKKTDAEWKAELTREQYRIMRQKGTEPAFTGSLLDNKSRGTYACAACGQPLFDSETKFDSGSGWPSFTASLASGNVTELPDGSHGTQRTEVLCSRCDAHLGHVFNDGPEPTGQRYCINSAALDFEEKGETGSK